MNRKPRIDPSAGDKFDIAFAPFGGMDVMALGFEPWLRAAARCNLELLGLASRYTQAYFEAATQLAQCRTPLDVVGAQTRFWQTAARQTGESAQRLTALCGAAAQEP
ncbi:MAG: phasin family protein [Hyphomicrobiaceae bacterium]